MTDRKPGRPLTLDADLTERISNLVESTRVTYSTAAQALGVPRSTAMSWQDQGRAAQHRRDMTAADRKAKGLPTIAKDRPFLELMDSVDEAKAKAVMQLSAEMLASIKADPKGWQGHLKVLGVLEPETYRETKRTEVTGAQGGPIQQETTVLTPQQVLARAQAVMPVATMPPAPVFLDDEDDDDSGEG